MNPSGNGLQQHGPAGPGKPLNRLPDLGTASHVEALDTTQWGAPTAPGRALDSGWDPESLDWNTLPSKLREMHQLVGAACTVLLAEAYGGAAMYVPHAPHAMHPLVICIGMQAAAALSTAYGGEKLHIPKADAIERQVRLTYLLRRRGEGASVSTLAQECQLTPRRVRQILAS